MSNFQKEIDRILLELKSDHCDVDQVLIDLSDIGLCPNLLNDGMDNWAVSFEGYSDVPIGDEPDDICTMFHIKKEQLKETPTEALIHALENLEE